MRRAQVNCPAAHTLRVLSGMWKVPIVWHLQSGTKRFGELRREVGGVTQKVLAQQLRELERDGIVNRRIFPVVPLKVEYSLTPLGKTLRPVIAIMCAWGTSHAKQSKLAYE
ncbi:MAG TPA: helix-turn-helix domain-containing protein [Tepidisphaeraceae bacterium]|nr:helix-turn-helix domain-containing protein [Tepidisphaeraceae bacterium]